MKVKILHWMLIFVALAMKANANELSWDFNPYAFQYDMTVYVDILSIDGKSVADKSTYQIAAFCNNECRGKAVHKTDGAHPYIYLRVRSNKAEGETISFRVKDVATGKEAFATETITFQSQQTMGFPSSPFLLNVKNEYGVTFLMDGVKQTQNLCYGDSITAPKNPEKLGYTFTGWTPTVDATVPAHDVVYTATYKVNYYKLTYVLNDTIFAEDSLAYGAAISPRVVDISENETFSGWEGIPATMPAHNVTVYGSTMATGIKGICKAETFVTVYALNGTVIKRNVNKRHLTKVLRPGLYVVAGKKVWVKYNE